MCSDSDFYYRKLALINLELTEENYSDIVERTRDTDMELRLTVYRKLIKEKIFLANLQLCDIYKLAYDGLM